MMKPYFSAALLVCLLLFSFTACSAASDNGGAADGATETAIQEDAVLSPVFGEWVNADGSTTLQINEAGQIVYTVNGEVLFRGYLTEEASPSDSDSGTLLYSFYNDADLLMMRYTFDTDTGVLKEENADGVAVDQYTRK